MGPVNEPIFDRNENNFIREGWGGKKREGEGLGEKGGRKSEGEGWGGKRWEEK